MKEQKSDKFNSPFMILKEVCDYLRVKKRTVYSLIKNMKLPAVKIGRQWRFYIEDVEKYLKEKKFHYGVDVITHRFFKEAVLDKYRKESMSGQKYYLHDEAFSGKLGIRQDYHDVKTLTSLKRKPPTGYKPFIDIHYRKVTLKNEMKSIVLTCQQHDSMPNSEHTHWSKYFITHPEV